MRFGMRSGLGPVILLLVPTFPKLIVRLCTACTSHSRTCRGRREATRGGRIRKLRDGAEGRLRHIAFPRASVVSVQGFTSTPEAELVGNMRTMLDLL